jgi:hypothetical protein
VKQFLILDYSEIALRGGSACFGGKIGNLPPEAGPFGGKSETFIMISSSVVKLFEFVSSFDIRISNLNCGDRLG